MLQNRSTPFKLEKTIFITINLTLCTTSWRRRWGCRGQCPQLRMGHLWRFCCTRLVLWAYWHRPVAQFPRRRRRRQPEHGWCGGDLEGSLTVDLLRRWAPLGAVAEFGDSAASMPLGCCQWEGARVLVGGMRGGVKKCPWWWWCLGWPQFFDVGCLMPYFSMKKYGGGTMLVCYYRKDRGLRTAGI